jgi:hypothetical protein
MKNKILISMLIGLAGIAASAETMDCAIGVYRAEDMTESASQTKTTALVKTTLKVGDTSEAQAVINGETVAIELTRKQYTDLYDMNVFLMTPAADRPTKRQYVTLLTDNIYNDGPIQNNGWDVSPGPNAIDYSFLISQGGAFMMTPKLYNAIKAAGLLGNGFNQFSSARLSAMETQNLVSVVQSFVKNGTLKASDVVGISTVFSCDKNP